MAAYRFAVTFQLTPDGVRADPDTFETTVEKPAAEPGEEGWRFFRNTLWHGEISDSEPFERRMTEWLGVDVLDCEFRAFECTPGELAALKEEIAEDLDAFRAESVDAVVHNYLGSSLEVAENT